MPAFDWLDYSWIVLLTFLTIRSLIPVRSQTNYMNRPIGEDERTEYRDSRNHNITLASFTIAALAFIIAFPREEILQLKQAAFYLSVAMFCFFIASYLFTFRTNKWSPYTGETLEYVGIIAVGIGFLWLMGTIFTDLIILVIYLVFLIGILIVAFIDLYLNKKFFHPKIP